MPVAYGVVQICEELAELVVMLGLLLQSVSHFAGLQFGQWKCMIHAPVNLVLPHWVGLERVTLQHE